MDRVGDHDSMKCARPVQILAGGSTELSSLIVEHVWHQEACGVWCHLHDIDSAVTIDIERSACVRPRAFYDPIVRIGEKGVRIHISITAWSHWRRDLRRQELHTIIDFNQCSVVGLSPVIDKTVTIDIHQTSRLDRIWLCLVRWGREIQLRIWCGRKYEWRCSHRRNKRSCAVITKHLPGRW